jgi:predicted acetyltransferase
MGFLLCRGSRSRRVFETRGRHATRDPDKASLAIERSRVNLRPMIGLRAARPEDAPVLAATSQRAYPDRDSGLAARIERYLDGPLPLDEVIIAERDGEHVGQARTIDFRGWFGGVETRVGGLAGVAVTPEARGSGVAAALVVHHVEKLREQQVPWAMLYPFAASFYARHGWAPAARRLRWRFAPSALPRFEERRRARRLDLLAEEEAILGAYHRCCARVNGSLSKTPRFNHWQLDRSKDHCFGVAVGPRGGELDGYLLYVPHAPTPRPQTLVVAEWVARDAETERALLGFIAAQADQYQSVVLDTAVDHPLGAVLDCGVPEREDADMPPEHQPLAQLHAGAMARVIDLAGALAGRGYPGGAGVAAVEITDDPLVPENRRVVTVTVEDGLPRTREGRAEGAPLLQGAVGPISAVLTGGARVADAARLGLVRVSGDAGALDRLFALPVPHPLVIF